jgi:L-glutamine-phosphate cytidylyltransferase
VEKAMRQPEGLKWWYLKVIAQIAKSHRVEIALIQGLRWGEVDYPADLLRAERLAESWEQRR